jgi:predicted nucleic acid-binding protein
VTIRTVIPNTRKTSVSERFVIDASVAIASLRDERYSSPVRTALRRWSTSGIELFVHSHFWLEVTNSLIRRHGYLPSQVVEDLVNLDRLGLQTIELDRPLLLLAMDPMVEFGLSAYDAVYLALARATGSRLATLDARLAAAGGAIGLLLTGEEPRRLSETPATYRSAALDPGWAHSAVVGAEIARLRREFAAR